VSADRRRCVRCGKWFEPEGSVDVMCSSYCGEAERPGGSSRSQLAKAKRKLALDERWLMKCRYERCGRTFHAERKNQRYCPPPRGCKQAAYRDRKRTGVTFRDSSEGKDTGVAPNREYAPMNTGGLDTRNVTLGVVSAPPEPETEADDR
jgi:predicted  nucleic acid-binding Zn-ribbon protein